MTASSSSRAGVSPSSSPRLPSPPPFTEVQFGPKSPSIGGSISDFQLEADGKQDEGASRRVRPGSKAADMAKGLPFVALHQLESPFQLQEYLKSLYYKLTTDHATNTVRPVTKVMATELATPPTAADSGETVDRNLWLYELCRLLCSKTTRIIVAFFADSPPCSSQTCPEMRASEWQYLCAVHEPPKSCCAIDYCNHTLDWASNILTSTRHFPSRLSLGGEGGNAHQKMRQLTNIFRRVYRIYAHAWFQHREVFWTIEAELGLYMFFKTVCDVYQLIPEDNYTIPPEAEGGQDLDLASQPSLPSPQRKQVLQRETELAPNVTEPSQSTTNLVTGATTRRHKSTPSTGVPVAVIAEGAEEEEDHSQSDTTSILDQPLSTSPTASTHRKLSPGHIDIPENTDPERAPEDPTPIASYVSNPLGPSSLFGDMPEIQSTLTESGPGPSTITTAPLISNQSQIRISDPSDNDEPIQPHIQTGDNEDEVGNETMERIELSEPVIATSTPNISSNTDLDTNTKADPEVTPDTNTSVTDTNPDSHKDTPPSTSPSDGKTKQTQDETSTKADPESMQNTAKTEDVKEQEKEEKDNKADEETAASAIASA